MSGLSHRPYVSLPCYTSTVLDLLLPRFVVQRYIRGGLASIPLATFAYPEITKRRGGVWILALCVLWMCLTTSSWIQKGKVISSSEKKRGLKAVRMNVDWSKIILGEATEQLRAVKQKLEPRSHANELWEIPYSEWRISTTDCNWLLNLVVNMKNICCFIAEILQELCVWVTLTPKDSYDKLFET